MIFMKDCPEKPCRPPIMAMCSYTKVTIDGRLAGNVLACGWACDDSKVLWVT